MALFRKVDSIKAANDYKTFKNSSEAAGVAAFVALVESEIIPDEKAVEHKSIFPAWAEGVDYTARTVVAESSKLWRCKLDHTSDALTRPGQSTVWTELAKDTQTYPAWVQPEGTDAGYQVGDIVTHNGSLWRCEMEDCFAEPGVGTGWGEA